MAGFFRVAGLQGKSKYLGIRYGNRAAQGVSRIHIKLQKSGSIPVVLKERDSL